MKEAIKGIQERRPLKQYLSLPAVKPLEKATAAIKTLQPQLAQQLPQQVKTGKQRLAAQAQRINQLSAELEVAMLELKAIANELKREQRNTQAPQEPIKSVCEYSAALVPCVRHKKSGAFVLTTRPVDLFRGEREATQIAQALRRRAKKRQALLPNRTSKQSK